LDWQYTVFGEVARGLETVDGILNVRKDGNDNPLERIEMTVTVKEGA
jgi:peptidyl-prolyl cis-trans isomerase B (cyclophilin B)